MFEKVVAIDKIEFNLIIFHYHIMLSNYAATEKSFQSVWVEEWVLWKKSWVNDRILCSPDWWMVFTKKYTVT